MTHIVAAFYKFVKLPDFAQRREPLLSYCEAQGVRGTILLAEEGINGTIAATSREALDSVLFFLRSDRRLADLDSKLSSADSPPFERLKVRLKREIITIGLLGVDPNEQVGIPVSPQDWNTLTRDPEVTVIDTRNDYEVSIGTFKERKILKLPRFANSQIIFANTSTPANIKRLLCSVQVVFAVKKPHRSCCLAVFKKSISSKAASLNI